MFRSAAVLVSGLLLFTACNNEANTNTNNTQQDNLVTKPADTTPAIKTGNDTDERGCKTSAGYRWSVMKDTCIRIFEAGVKMDAKDPSIDKTKAAFVVFSSDRVRAEIFLPTQTKAVIIRRTEGPGEPTQWASGPLTLSLKEGLYTLEDEGKLLYQSAAAK